MSARAMRKKRPFAILFSTAAGKVKKQKPVCSSARPTPGWPAATKSKPSSISSMRTKREFKSVLETRLDGGAVSGCNEHDEDEVVSLRNHFYRRGFARRMCKHDRRAQLT